MASLRELQRRTEELFLSEGAAEALAEPRTTVRFSPFVPEHVEGALELVDRWIGLAESGRGNAGLEAALADVARELEGDDPERAKHALMIFITHHPKASQLPIPSLEERRPDLAAKAAEFGAEGLEAVGGEEQLDWFREDPLANQHHEHWHVVYPVRGIPDGQGARAGKDRQGELFFYMHQQMLARYDTERLAAGSRPCDRSRPTPARSPKATTRGFPTSVRERRDGASRRSISAAGPTPSSSTHACATAFGVPSTRVASRMDPRSTPMHSERPSSRACGAEARPGTGTSTASATS